MKYNLKDFKKLYRKFWQIAEVLAPEHTEELFDYIIHAMDNDGIFLRSRYRWWDKILPDNDHTSDSKTMLITLVGNQDFEDVENYYKDAKECFSFPYTNLKFQLFLGDYQDKKKLYNASEWGYRMGYSYVVIIDLVKGEYTQEEFVYK